ncbi:hypothetical protein JTL65_33605, partial [Pseudomonas aeruginosa]|nr:hypothetical protein [Pseudomonas aeruginosa]
KNRGGAIEQTGTQDLVRSAAHASNREGGRIGLAAADTGMPPGDGGTPGTGTDGTGGGSTGDGSTGGDRPGTGVAPLANGALNIAATFDNDGGRIMAGGDIDL